MLLDEDAEHDHGQGDDRADSGLRAVQTTLDGALELVEQDGQGRYLWLREGQRQQEFAPVEDKNEGRNVTIMPEATRGSTTRRRV